MSPLHLYHKIVYLILEGNTDSFDEVRLCMTKDVLIVNKRGNAMHVSCNIEARSRNHCYRRKATLLLFIIIIIIIVLGISFMQGIYTYVPETNHVPREHCVATILM